MTDFLALVSISVNVSNLTSKLIDELLNKDSLYISEIIYIPNK